MQLMFIYIYTCIDKLYILILTFLISLSEISNIVHAIFWFKLQLE